MATVKGHGIVWDASANAPLIRFTDGVCEVTDEKVIAKLEKLGYTVEGKPETKTEDEPKPETKTTRSKKKE